MGVITVTSFVGSGATRLQGGMLDAAFKAISDALTGGLDETNLLASAKLSPAQFARRRGLSALHFTPQSLTAVGTVGASAYWKVPVMEAASIVGYSFRIAPPTGDSTKYTLRFTASFESPEAPGASVQITDTLDQNVRVLRQPFVVLQSTNFHTKFSLKPDTWLGVGIENKGPAISSVSLALFLARQHTDR